MKDVIVELYIVTPVLGGHPGEKRGSWVPYSGKFHTWGMEADEGVSYSVAIVELPDGKIVTALPEKTRFCNELRS